MNHKKVRIVSLPRLLRLGKNLSHFNGRHQQILYMAKFSPMDNRYENLPDEGIDFYRYWLLAQLENGNQDIMNTLGIAFKHHHQLSNITETIIVVSSECNPPPKHAVMIKRFIETGGAVL